VTRHELARTIDHTLLKPEATPAHVDVLCDEAREYGFFAVCVNPIYVRPAAERLRGSRTCVASVAGFPLGAQRSDVKADEARRAIDDGAAEVDMVIHVGALLAGDVGAVRDDIYAVSKAVHAGAQGRILKVILETGLLSADQIIAGCRCAAEGEADFVKTSTGFHASGGATIEAVRLMHKHAAPIKVKASGGIRDLRTALAMLEAGASRLGVSAGVAIVSAFEAS